MMTFSEHKGNPEKLSTEDSLYAFKSIWPNETTNEVCSIIHSYYYSDQSRKDLSVLFQEMTDVSIVVGF